LVHSKPSLSSAPAGGPLTQVSSIAAITDAHFQQCLTNLSVLTDVDFKAYMQHTAGQFFRTYGFVAQEESNKDYEAAAAEAAAVAEAAAASAAAASSKTQHYSVD
jgi:hypothetical protein